jgi:NADPH:quinone reductase-like Zn-dependent oxidoreductase
MIAWLIEQHGGPEVLKQKELPRPEVRDDEVLVKVRALSLNHLDLWVRKGVPGHKFPLPIIPGCDIVGEIDSFGVLSEKATQFKEVSDLKKGDRVVVEIPIRNILKLPVAISDEKAAALPVSGITAWSMIHRKAELKRNEVVLIQAGASGVSSYAIQIARNLGASKIITTTGSDGKKEKLKSLGATHVFNYKTEDVKKSIRSLLGSKRGVDVVLEHVGGETFEESLKLLDWGGRLVTCGATTGSRVNLNLNALFFKNISLYGCTMGGQGDLRDLITSVEKGLISPQIHKVFNFNEYDLAQKELENPDRFGKVVVKF